MKNSLRKSFGLAQIPLMIVLLLMAVAVPVATKLVQNNADNRNMAAGGITNVCQLRGPTGDNCSSTKGNLGCACAGSGANAGKTCQTELKADCSITCTANCGTLTGKVTNAPTSATHPLNTPGKVTKCSDMTDATGCAYTPGCYWKDNKCSGTYPTSTSAGQGSACNTGKGWPGTCTLNKDCNQAKAGIAFDMAGCGGGFGCCGVQPGSGVGVSPTGIRPTGKVTKCSDMSGVGDGTECAYTPGCNWDPKTRICSGKYPTSKPTSSGGGYNPPQATATKAPGGGGGGGTATCNEQCPVAGRPNILLSCVGGQRKLTQCNAVGLAQTCGDKCYVCNSVGGNWVVGAASKCSSVTPTPSDLKCGWCGDKCDPVLRGQICQDVMPPEGKVCVAENNKCVIKDGTLTPTLAPGETPVLNYRISFAGVKPNSAQCVIDWPLTITVLSAGKSAAYTDVIAPLSATVGDKLVFAGSLELTDFPYLNRVAVFIAGPKHIQVKYGENNQTGPYNQAGGKITLTTDPETSISYDFSGYPLIAGDVVGSGSEEQDGVINGIDFVYVKAKSLVHETCAAGGYLKADLDGNCQVNSNDVNLLKISLQEKQGQLY